MERMADRLAARPEVLDRRRESVEHPFGSIKQWMGQGAFLTRRLDNVRGEFSLTALAYNLRRANQPRGHFHDDRRSSRLNPGFTPFQSHNRPESGRQMVTAVPHTTETVNGPTDRGPAIANPPTGSALILPNRAEHNLGFSHALLRFL